MILKNKSRYLFLLILSLNILLISCKLQTREESILYIMREGLLAAQENNIVKFSSIFDELTYPKFDSQEVRSDLIDLYYLIQKYHDGKIDSLDWTSDLHIDLANRLTYDVIVFEGFDSLTGYKQVMMRYYFWKPQYGAVKAIAGYSLIFDVDYDYRAMLNRQGKLPDSEVLLDYIKIKRL